MKEVGRTEINNHYCTSCRNDTQHLTTITDVNIKISMYSFERHCLDCGREWNLGDNWCMYYHKPKNGCKFCERFNLGCPYEKK